MRPFLGDRHVIDLVQQAVHTGTPSMIETRFPNRSGPSMLFVRSSATVKKLIDSLQVVPLSQKIFSITPVFFCFLIMTFLLMQCDALSSIDTAAALPKDQRDMKVVQVL